MNTDPQEELQFSTKILSKLMLNRVFFFQIFRDKSWGVVDKLLSKNEDVQQMADPSPILPGERTLACTLK